MIIKHLETLKAKRIVLASRSPRRQELLNLIGLQAKPYPSKFEETLKPKDFASPGDYAIETAKHKAIDVSQTILDVWDLIIAADTIVELDGDVLEKPLDSEDAIKTLMRLSGRQHAVFTGVSLLLHSKSEPFVSRSFSVESQVWFDDFDQAEAEAYVRTGEPMDKAGSYGIQGYGGLLVQKIDGCYFNVMGLPIHELACHLNVLINEHLL